MCCLQCCVETGCILCTVVIKPITGRPITERFLRQCIKISKLYLCSKFSVNDVSRQQNRKKRGEGGVSPSFFCHRRWEWTFQIRFAVVDLSFFSGNDFRNRIYRLRPTNFTNDGFFSLALIACSRRGTKFGTVHVQIVCQTHNGRSMKAKLNEVRVDSYFMQYPEHSDISPCTLSMF